jgi:hypothetical protein
MNELRICDVDTSVSISHVYVHTMQSHPAIRKNETMWFEGKWIQLVDIMISQVNQVQKDKGYMLSLTCGRQTQYKSKQYC